jgi:hypothetical protein
MRDENHTACSNALSIVAQDFSGMTTDFGLAGSPTLVHDRELNRLAAG